MSELADLFLEEVSTLDFGKKTPTAVYIHDSLVPKLPPRLNSLIGKLDDQYSPQISWNIVKLFARAKLSFLSTLTLTLNHIRSSRPLSSLT